MTETEQQWSETDRETLWPTVPADAKPGDDALLSELSAPQRLALPAAFHRPYWMGSSSPPLWICAACWGDGWSTAWPCEPARLDGGTVVLDPKAVLAAEQRGGLRERHLLATEMARVETWADPTGQWSADQAEAASRQKAYMAHRIADGLR